MGARFDAMEGKTVTADIGVAFGDKSLIAANVVETSTRPVRATNSKLITIIGFTLATRNFQTRRWACSK